MVNIRRLLLLLVSILAILLVFYILFSRIPYYWIFIGANFVFLYSGVVYLLSYWERGGIKDPVPKKFPEASVIIPCYNSGKTIVQCVNAVKNMQYPKKFQVIVIDDGSTDGSIESIQGIKEIEIIKKGKNEGKASALNYALKHAKGELVACVDSDTYPSEDSLIKLVGYFEDKQVGAATALICVNKPRNILQKLQEIEYYVAFGFWHKALSLLNALIVTPGPMSVFRKDTLVSIGGFDETNITEDMEIALRLQSKGYKIACCVNTKVYTEVPDTIRKYFRQRIRWYRGKIFNGAKYSFMLFNPKFKDFGMFVFPVTFVVEILGVVVAARVFAMYLNEIFTFISRGLAWAYVSSTPPIQLALDAFTVNSSFYFVTISLLIWLYIVTTSFGFAREKITLVKLPILIVFLFFYYLLISVSYFISALHEINGSEYKW